MIGISVAIPGFLENHQEKKEQISAVCAYHGIHFIEDIEVIKSIDAIKMGINRIVIIEGEKGIEKLLNNPELFVIETNKKIGKIINDNYFYDRGFGNIDIKKLEENFEIKLRETLDFPFIERGKKERGFSSPQDIFRNPKANMGVKSRK